MDIGFLIQSIKRGIGNDYELFENVIDFTDGSFSTKYVIPITE